MGFEKQVGRPSRIVLDTATMAPFEIGARLDALLCYSTWSTERQQRIADAICADMMAQWIELEPGREAELYEARPQYRKSKNRISLAHLHDRRDEALLAGKAFLPLLKVAAYGDLPILHGRRRELSLSEIGRFLWPPRENGDEVHYDSRLHDKQKYLRRLRPIAHLAAAYQTIAHDRSGGEEAAPFDYQDIDLHREAVVLAKRYASYFQSMPAWAVIARNLLNIEWR